MALFCRKNILAEDMVDTLARGDTVNRCINLQMMWNILLAEFVPGTRYQVPHLSDSELHMIRLEGQRRRSQPLYCRQQSSVRIMRHQSLRLGAVVEGCNTKVVILPICSGAPTDV